MWFVLSSVFVEKKIWKIKSLSFTKPKIFIALMNPGSKHAAWCGRILPIIRTLVSQVVSSFQASLLKSFTHFLLPQSVPILLPSHPLPFLHSTVSWTAPVKNLCESSGTATLFPLSVCFLGILHLLVLSKLNQKHLSTLSAQLYYYTLSCLQFYNTSYMFRL